MGSAARLARARLRGTNVRRIVRPRRTRRGRREWVFIAVEATALAGAGMIGVIAALGRFADWFVGSGLWRNLLPFAAAVLGLAVLTGVAIRAWLGVRGPLAERWPPAPAAGALVTAVGALWFAFQPAFSADVHHLQALIGGRAAAERAAIAHQVYAAYRRADRINQQRMFKRSQPYESMVEEAAMLFDLDPALLMGVAATESAFRPRRSADGGRGLFQITTAPDAAQRAARGALQIDQLDLGNDRHNVFAGAATLRAYLDEMHDDLFLGLLAYNIGPKNGGLLAIMRQYAARDFVTIQPYLQQLPRDYPIRVLSAALAYRLWKADGRLPKYEEGDNAARIQAGGIPGLDS
jgi:soluble lytic murein transglycosylase-like protein